MPGRCLLGGKEKLDAKLARAREMGHSGDKQPAMSTFEATRPAVGAQALGIARAAYEFSLDYAKHRMAFGKPIVMHQAIAFKLANMAVEIDAARLLIWRAAWLARNGGFKNGEGSMSKYKASEVAVRVTEDAIQILGGYGYTRDYPVERWHRDAKIHTIFEGTQRDPAVGDRQSDLWDADRVTLCQGRWARFVPPMVKSRPMGSYASGGLREQLAGEGFGEPSLVPLRRPRTVDYEQVVELRRGEGVDDVAGVPGAQVGAQRLGSRERRGDASLAVLALPCQLVEDRCSIRVGAGSAHQDAVDRCGPGVDVDADGCEPCQRVLRARCFQERAHVTPFRDRNRLVVTGDRRVEEGLEDALLRREQPIDRGLGFRTRC